MNYVIYEYLMQLVMPNVTMWDVRFWQYIITATFWLELCIHDVDTVLALMCLCVCVVVVHGTIGHQVQRYMNYAWHMYLGLHLLIGNTLTFVNKTVDNNTVSPCQYRWGWNTYEHNL